MNYSFQRKKQLRNALVLGTAAVLCAASFYGCSSKKVDQADTSADPIPSLVSTTETTVPVTTAAPTTAPKDIAIVKEQLNVRASPSMESNVISQLNAGEEVEVLRIESVNGVEWAYVKQGWIPTELLDLSNVSIAQGFTGSSSSTPANPKGTEPTVPATTAAKETTAPTEENPDQSVPSATTGTTTATQTTTGRLGVVVASALNVRSAASTDSSVVGSVSYGDRVTVTQISNNWGKIGSGWIKLDYVYLDGTNGNYKTAGTVTGSGVNVRSGPGTGYAAVGSYAKGTRITVLEQVVIGGNVWGCTGTGNWVSMAFVSPDVDYGLGSGSTTPTGETTTSGTSTSATGTVIGENVNVRVGAGTGYEVIDNVSYGDVVKISEYKTVNGVTWGHIETGWISMQFVRVNT